MIWLFIWDDDMDQTSGPLSNDLEASKRYRKGTSRYLQYSLGFWPASETAPVAPSVIVAGFRDNGDALCRAYTESETI